MSDESDENGLFQGLDPQEMADDNSEINSSDFEDISDTENDIICGFCQNPNAKIFTNLYDGVRFCDKFCANRYHLKQKASLEENKTNPMAGNKNAKKKGVGQRKNRHQGKSRQRGGEKQKDPEKRRVLKPKLKTASKGIFSDTFLSSFDTFLIISKPVFADPFSTMKPDEIKPFAVNMFEKSLSFKDDSGLILTREQSYNIVAHMLGKSDRFVREQVHQWEANQAFFPSQRGKHSKNKSPMDDEEFREYIIQYIKAESRKKGKKNLTAQMLADYINEDYLNIGNEEDKYTARTMRRWVHSLGFTYREPKKATYFDGHERPENIMDRKRLYEQIKGINGLLTFDPVTGEPNNLDTATKILVVEDETSQESNDVQRFFWGDNAMNFPPPKSRGMRIMSSDFVDELHGYLQYR